MYADRAPTKRDWSPTSSLPPATVAERARCEACSLAISSRRREFSLSSDSSEEAGQVATVRARACPNERPATNGRATGQSRSRGRATCIGAQRGGRFFPFDDFHSPRKSTEPHPPKPCPLASSELPEPIAFPSALRRNAPLSWLVGPSLIDPHVWLGPGCCWTADPVRRSCAHPVNARRRLAARGRPRPAHRASRAIHEFVHCPMC